MMVASQLPNFEIPTGLMATGLRGLRGFGKGLRGLGYEGEETSSDCSATGPYGPGYAPIPPTTDQNGIIHNCGLATPLCPPISKVPGMCAWGSIGDMPGGYDTPQDYLAAQQAFWNGPISPYCASWQAQQVACFNNMLAGGSPTVSAATLDQQACAQLGGSIDSKGNCILSTATTNPASNPASYTPVPGVTVQPVAQPPVTPANPTGVPPTVPASPTCTSIQASIAAWQASGLSNAVIYSAIQQQAPSLLSCASVQALTTSAAAPPAGSGTQPGDLQGSGTNNTNNTTPGADNTTLYVGIGIALLVGALILGGQK